jgi:PAS domain S-box-containing protein
MDFTSTSSEQPPGPGPQPTSVAVATDTAAMNAQLTAAEYRLLVEHSPVMIWRSGRDKKCDYFNRVWLEFTGRTMAQESGDGWAEGVHPEDLERCFKIYTSSFDQRLPFEMEYRMRRHDGVYRWIFDRGVPCVDDHGDFLGYIGSCVDVTDRKEAGEARRRSEDQFRLLVQQVNDYAILMLDPQGHVVSWNEGALKIKGYTADEILGRSFETFYPADVIASGFPRHELEMAARDGRFEDEGWRVRKNGSLFWANVVITAIRDASGSLVGYAKVTRDLTLRREAEHRSRELAAEKAAHAAAAKKNAELEDLNHRLEEALADAEQARAAAEQAYRQLREREAEFRTLANAIPQLAWMADCDGRRYWFNDRWYEYTGLRPDQCLGLGWQTASHPDHRARVVEGQQAAFKAGRVWEETNPLRRADGEYRWFLSRAESVKDADGRIVRWIGTNTDISEHLESKRALAASEDRLRRALAIETVGVIFFTVDGDITGANDAFLRMSGYTRDDLEAGRLRWDELTAREFIAQSQRAVEELKATGRTTPYEKQYVRLDGTRGWALFAATRLSDDEGVEFVVDLTAHKAVEREREALLERERDARVEAERATKLRDDVLAILAHDLRNPLHLVLGAAAMLALTAEQDKRQRQVNVIERAVRSMERLVADLLDVARMESGTFGVCKEKVDTRTLIDDAIELCEPQALARHIALGAEVPGDVEPMLADRDRLLQVLSNLLGNALKFSDAGGQVVVRAANTDDSVQISVTDSGHGIPADDLPHVFDRFWQADRSSRAGAGLGLAICKGIVEAHGGRIWAVSAVGRGTTLHFEIARYPSAAGAGT